MPVSSPLVLWRLLDGRRGHRTQIEGLCQALAERTTVHTHDLEAESTGDAIRQWLRAEFPAGERLPAPDLILAAGHRTHLPALAARRAHGGRIVVLMKPSLPLRWFDLCLIPQHDRPPRRDNVIATRGVLHGVRPSEHHDPATGLILLGGPSRHHDWDADAIALQVRRVVTARPEVRFIIGDSPRTPPDTLQRLDGLENARLLHWAACAPGEIQQRMREAGQIWVSEDSVSMLYEALGSGAPVGLLAVPRRRDTRVSRGVDRLIADGLITPFEHWVRDHRLTEHPPLDEAARCATEILARISHRADGQHHPYRGIPGDK